MKREVGCRRLSPLLSVALVTTIDPVHRSITNLRMLTRAVLALFVVAALLPAGASAQTPGTGGYSGTGPEQVTGTGPGAGTEGSSGTLAEETSGSSTTDNTGTAPSTGASTDASTDALPFTGLQIAAMIAAGLGLLGLGMALRRASGSSLPGT